MRLAGEFGAIGPTLSSLDAHLDFTGQQPAAKGKDPTTNAKHVAAAQEARRRLGEDQQELP